MVVAGVTVANGAARTRVPGARPSWARASNLVRQVRPDSRVDFLVFLGWRDPAAVTAVARAVSDPQPVVRPLPQCERVQGAILPDALGLAAVRSWLSGSGLRVGAVPASRLWVAASGRASDVERALGTTLGMYRVGQTLRLAPSSDPLVPAALSGVVRGFVGLSDVRMQARHRDPPPETAGVQGRPAVQPVLGREDGGRQASRLWGDGAYTVCGYEPDQLRSAYGMSDAITPGSMARVRRWP